MNKLKKKEKFKENYKRKWSLSSKNIVKTNNIYVFKNKTNKISGEKRKKNIEISKINSPNSMSSKIYLKIDNILLHSNRTITKKHTIIVIIKMGIIKTLLIQITTISIIEVFQLILILIITTTTIVILKMKTFISMEILKITFKIL